jgi:hypothetical protein
MIDGPWRFAINKQVAAALLLMATSWMLTSSAMAEEPEFTPEPPPAASAASLGQCQELVALLAEQDQKYSREFRQIKRDIASLSQQVAEPGMREILGGIGYIFGLLGIAAYVASRKKVGGGGA